MLGKVDAVSIAVPTSEHHKVARDFLAAGVDVLIEKPICATLEEADELIGLAKKNNLILQVGFVERFNPAIMALENVIEKPMFIEAHRLHPFFERGTDVDVILDLMIHDLDIILKFVNSPLTSVEAVGVPILSDKIDISNVRLSFAGLHRQHYSQPHQRQDHAKNPFFRSGRISLGRLPETGNFISGQKEK
jgi:predicted dehydrogenase